MDIETTEKKTEDTQKTGQKTQTDDNKKTQTEDTSKKNQSDENSKKTQDARKDTATGGNRMDEEKNPSKFPDGRNYPSQVPNPYGGYAGYHGSNTQGGFSGYNAPYSPHTAGVPDALGSPHHYNSGNRAPFGAQPPQAPVSVQTSQPIVQPYPHPAQPGYHPQVHGNTGMHPYARGEFDIRGAPIPHSIKQPGGEPQSQQGKVFHTPTHHQDPAGFNMDLSYPMPGTHQHWGYAGYEKFHPHDGLTGSGAAVHGSWEQRREDHERESRREEKRSKKQSQQGRPQDSRMAGTPQHGQGWMHPDPYHPANQQQWAAHHAEVHGGHPWINPRDFDTKYPSMVPHALHGPQYHAYPPGHPYSIHPPSPLVAHHQAMSGASTGPHTPHDQGYGPHPALGKRYPNLPLHVPLPGPFDLAPSPFHGSPAHYNTPIHHPFAGASYMGMNREDDRRDGRRDESDRRNQKSGDRDLNKRSYDDEDSDRDRKKNSQNTTSK